MTKVIARVRDALFANSTYPNLDKSKTLTPASRKHGHMLVTLYNELVTLSLSLGVE
jgi:hypothetical protein